MFALPSNGFNSLLIIKQERVSEIYFVFPRLSRLHILRFKKRRRRNRAPLSKLMCFLRALVSRYSVGNGAAGLFCLAKNKHDFLSFRPKLIKVSVKHFFQKNTHAPSIKYIIICMCVVFSKYSPSWVSPFLIHACFFPFRRGNLKIMSVNI